MRPCLWRHLMQPEVRAGVPISGQSCSSSCHPPIKTALETLCLMPRRHSRLVPSHGSLLSSHEGAERECRPISASASLQTGTGVSADGPLLATLAVTGKTAVLVRGFGEHWLTGPGAWLAPTWLLSLPEGAGLL